MYPMKAYHGSRIPRLPEFDWTFCGTGIVSQDRRAMFYFSNDCDAASYFADFDGISPDSDFIVRCEIDTKGFKVYQEMGDYRKRISEAFNSGKYEGLIFRQVCDGSFVSDVVIVFELGRIKILGYGA